MGRLSLQEMCLLGSWLFSNFVVFFVWPARLQQNACSSRWAHLCKKNWMCLCLRVIIALIVHAHHQFATAAATTTAALGFGFGFALAFATAAISLAMAADTCDLVTT